MAKTAEDGATAWKESDNHDSAKNGDHIAMRKNPHLEDVVTDPVRRSRKSILKNVIVVSSGFLLLFTAFQSVSNLQSSINSEQGLGTYTLATIYAALVVSCMFVPTFMISRLGLKYTLVVSMLMYAVYFIANFYPRWLTMIPASIILGLGGAPLWTAKCAYLTILATEYARKTGQKPVDVVTRFFGVFFMIFQTAQIWGNLISYYVLKPGGPPVNVTLNLSIESCGVNFVTAEEITDNANLQPPESSKLYTLMSIYTVCAFLSALSVLVLLDPLATQPREEDKKRSSFYLLVETLRHMRKPYQWAIVPLTIYSGVEQAFLVGDFTQAYVSCSLGIHNVGFVMITFGLADAVFSMVFGSIIKVVGRIPIFVFGAIVNAAIIVVLYLWRPSPEEPYVFFIIAGCWGLGDAVWQTQVNAFYGMVFADSEEAAFANYRLWESVGFILAFAVQKVLFISHKLVMLAVLLAAGMIGYLYIEVHLKLKKRRKLTLQ